jgi:peptide/bleomycin uptake transporter
MVMFKSFFCTKEWALWAWVGIVIIVASLEVSVQIMVKITKWQGTFFNLVAKAHSSPGSVNVNDLYRECLVFAAYAGIIVLLQIFSSFLIQHWLFRWRQAMTCVYLDNWEEIRDIEGSSQRVQNDTSRFIRITENVGSGCVSAVLTLLSYLPMLSRLSAHVIDVPVFGNAPNSLVYVAVVSAVFISVMFALTGMRLPRLEYNNQLAEAAYRKELVIAEDIAGYTPQDKTMWEIFMELRRSYFRLYCHFVYFNVVRYSLLQFQVIVPFLALVPTVAAGKASVGMINETASAFSQVIGAFEILANDWTSIVEWAAIFLRLRELDVQIRVNHLKTQTEWTESQPESSA